MTVVDQEPQDETETKRLKLVWELMKFQAKLVLDGVRDLLLSPISIVSVLLGLIFGGSEPDRYYKRLLHLGRRSDVWINLFGVYRRGPTSDRLVEQVEQRMLNEYQRGGWFSKAGKSVNRALDSVNDMGSKPDPSGDPTAPVPPASDRDSTTDQ